MVLTSIGTMPGWLVVESGQASRRASDFVFLPSAVTGLTANRQNANLLVLAVFGCSCTVEAASTARTGGDPHDLAVGSRRHTWFGCARLRIRIYTGKLCRLVRKRRFWGLFQAFFVYIGLLFEQNDRSSKSSTHNHPKPICCSHVPRRVTRRPFHVFAGQIEVRAQPRHPTSVQAESTRF